MAESKPSSASLKKGSFADQLSARLAPYMAEITKSNIEQATKKFDEMIKDLNGDPELLGEIYNFTSKGFERQTESMVVLSRIKQVTEETLGLLSGVSDNEEKPGVKSDSSSEEDSDTVKYLKQKQEEDEKKEVQEVQEAQVKEQQDAEEQERQEEQKEQKSEQSSRKSADIVKAMWHTAFDPIKSALGVLTKRKDLVHDALVLLLLWLPTKFSNVQEALTTAQNKVNTIIKSWIDSAKDEILQRLPSSLLSGSDKIISMLTDKKWTGSKARTAEDTLMAMGSDEFNELYKKIVTEGYGKDQKNYQMIANTLERAKSARNSMARVWTSTTPGTNRPVRYKAWKGLDKLAENIGMTLDELMDYIQGTNAYSEALQKIDDWTLQSTRNYNSATYQSKDYQKVVQENIGEALVPALNELGVNSDMLLVPGWSVDSTTGTNPNGYDTINSAKEVDTGNNISVTYEKVPFVEQLRWALKENF